MHHAEIHRARADVDDHGVVEHAQAVGHRERLGDDHQRVGVFFYGVADGELVDFERLGRHPHGGVNFLVFVRIDQFDEVVDEFADGL